MLYIMMTVMGALIGWGTNIIAIGLLFRPRKPICFGPCKPQGLLPRRQADIARNIGQAVEKELFTATDLSNHLTNPELKHSLSATVSEVIHCEIDERLPQYLPQSLRKWLTNYFSSWAQREGEAILDSVLKIVNNNLSEIQVSLIEHRLNSFPLEELEALLELAGKELRYIEYAGGVLGGVLV